jgi:hypothetical protein
MLDKFLNSFKSRALDKLEQHEDFSLLSKAELDYFRERRSKWTDLDGTYHFLLFFVFCFVISCNRSGEKLVHGTNKRYRKKYCKQTLFVRCNVT